MRILSTIIIRNGVNCERCHRKLNTTETVWKQYSRYGLRSCLGSICDDCFFKRTRYGDEEFWEERLKWALKSWREPLPCAHCGRQVRISKRYKLRLIVCSPACRVAIYAAQTKLRRAHSPQPCMVCEKSFTPKRTDSRYCSAACKQKAYRRRANVSRPAENFSTLIGP